MSTFIGPAIAINGLVMSVDASNTKSIKGKRSLINWDNWAVGTGGVTGYGANGSTAENQRLLDTNPWGTTDVVWGSYPTGTSDADGGWDGAYFNIDRTKLYRFSTWIRRTSATTGGTFYLGTNADGEGVRRTDNGTVQGNPYWDCRGISWMTQNQWYLVTGHIYPATSTYTGRHPESGVYTVSGGRFGDISGCNIGNDLRWGNNCTSAMHRSYHYYCPDSTSRLQWYQPRVDLCDGTEPTIAELLNNAGNTWFDLSGNNHHITLGPGVTYTNTVGGVLTFAKNADGYGRNSTMNLSGSNNTVISVVRKLSDSDNGRTITALNNNWLLAHHDTTYGDYYAEGWVNDIGSPASDTTWRMYAGTGNVSTDVWQAYINNTQLVSNANGTQGPNGWNLNNQYSQYSSCQIAVLKAFNRVLTPTEIAQTFDSLRSRFQI